MKTVLVILLIIVLGGVLVIGGCAAPAQAPAPTQTPAQTPSQAQAEPIVWKWANMSHENSPINSLPKWLFDQVEERSGGRFKVEYHLNNTLVPTNEQPDAIKADIIQATYLYQVQFPEKMPLVNMTCLPFLWPEGRTKVASLLMDYYEQPEVKAEFDKWDMFPITPSAFNYFHYIGKKPLAKVDDFKGLRVRSSGEWAKIDEHFGGVSIKMSPTEVYEAFQKGMIDIACSSTTAMLAERMYEVSDYFNQIGGGSGNMCVVVLKKSAYDALPADIKAIMDELIEIAPAHFAEEYDKLDQTAIDTFKEAGLEMVKMPPEEVAKIREFAKTNMWKEYVDKWEEQGAAAGKMLDYIAQITQ